MIDTEPLIRAIKTKPKAPRNDPYSRVSKIHKYWSRKPWWIIDELISTFSRPGDLVLDPFCGSGITGLESRKLGRSYVGSDLNPIAIRISEAILDTSFDTLNFQNALQEIRTEVEKKIDRLYRIREGLVLYSTRPDPATSMCSAVVRQSDDRGNIRLEIQTSDLPTVQLTAADWNVLPNKCFPIKFHKDRFSYKGIRAVTDLFSHRNLKALAILAKSISKIDQPIRRHLELCLSNTLLHVSCLKSEAVRPLGVNNYWIPDDFIEENVWWRFQDRCKQYLLGQGAIESTARKNFVAGSTVTQTVRLGDARDLSWIESQSVDYVITDPPYGDAIQYSELSFVWNSWLDEAYSSESEIIINPAQSKDAHVYLEMLDQFVEEITRVLSNRGVMTLSFHSRDLGLWSALASILFERDFSLLDIRVSDGVGSPFTKNWARFSPKSDIYVTVSRGKPRAKKLRPAASAFQLSAVLEELFKDEELRKLSIADSYDLVVMSIIQATMKGFRLNAGDQLSLKSVAGMIDDFLVSA